MTVAGLRSGRHNGRATVADNAGSAGKGEPPPIRQVGHGLAFYGRIGGDAPERKRVLCSVVVVSTEKLERECAAIKVLQLADELW